MLATTADRKVPTQAVKQEDGLDILLPMVLTIYTIRVALACQYTGTHSTE